MYTSRNRYRRWATLKFLSAGAISRDKKMILNCLLSLQYLWFLHFRYSFSNQSDPKTIANWRRPSIGGEDLLTQAFVAADTRSDLRNWNVGDLLSYAATHAPDRIAIKQSVGWEGYETCSWTYAELRALSRRLATYLLSHFQPGEHIAIWAANSAQWTLYQLATAQAGLVLVTLNPALREREVADLLVRSRAVGLLLDSEYRGTNLIGIISALRKDLPALRVVLPTAEWRRHLEDAPGSDPDVVIPAGDTAMIMFTSGTTGRPKGVALHHFGIVNNAWLGSERWELPHGAVWMGTLPLFHIGGSVTSTLGCMSRLGTNIVIPSFEAGKVLHLLETEKAAWIPTVPTTVIAMVEHEAFRRTDLSNLQVLTTGGTTITPEFIRMTREHFAADIMVMFGQTEAGGGLCKTFRKDPSETLVSTVGFPFPHTALKIVDPKTNVMTNVGVAGEVRINSPFMVKGYLDNPQATAAAFDNEGFLCTGDIGIVDEHGYLSITGRMKEMIIRGGENIYPREIEDVLGEFPGIVEAAVVGVPDPRWGEEIAAAIRFGAQEAIDLEDVRKFLLERIARHKVPKLWRIVKDFPRTPLGKIKKFEVIQEFLESK